MLLFGRTTYDMMSSFWPTEAAHHAMPKVADGMNKSDKIVFSRRLRKAHWNNTRIISKNITDAVLKMKKEGKIMTILGSGSIVSHFADAGIIDEYQFLLDPVAIAKGTTLFKGIKNELQLQLINSKVFKSGSILLCYTPRKNS